MSVVREILQDTKAIIQDRGWCQYNYTDSQGRVCLSEAFRRAFEKTVENDDVNYVLNWHIARGRIESLTSLSMIGFNDTHGRTKEEVLDLLDRAIES